MRLIIVGGTGGAALGDSFQRAAQAQGFPVRLLDVAGAYRTNALMRRIHWHLLGRRPYHLRRFSEAVVRAALEHRADVVLTTGIAPPDARAVADLERHGIRRWNYLTDDPWNRAHHAPWFIAALGGYDHIFSPRRANMSELRAAGARRVDYLPFAYDEALWYPEPADAHGEQCAESDVYFAGTGDRERIPYISALLEAKLRVRLHGTYWDRYAATRGLALGQAAPSVLRACLAKTKVALCLVRRANRDGNCMRTFEVPAVGACMLAEDTAEHREIFGPEGEAVLFFRDPREMVEKSRLLIADSAYRQRLAAAAHALITGGENTYRHRLLTMCAMAGLR